MEHTGTIFGNVTVYPDGLLYADVSSARIEGTITFEYENEDDRRRMEEVLQDCEITYDNVVYIQHKHSCVEEVIEPDENHKCTDPATIEYTCQTCGKVVKTEEIPAPVEHDYYVFKTDEATCTKGAVEHIRCRNCSAYNKTSGEWQELQLRVSDPLGHDYVELTQLYIPPRNTARDTSIMSARPAAICWNSRSMRFIVAKQSTPSRTRTARSIKARE